MLTFLRWILSTALTVIIIVFALANRENISVVWSPVHEAAEMPVFLVVLLGLALGFIAGGFLVWLNGAARRKENRKMRKTIRKMEKNLHKISPISSIMPTNESESLPHE